MMIGPLAEQCLEAGDQEPKITERQRQQRSRVHYPESKSNRSEVHNREADMIAEGLEAEIRRSRVLKPEKQNQTSSLEDWVQAKGR